MPDLEAILAELDPDEAETIRNALSAKSNEAAFAQRDLAVSRDAKLKEKFPRAFFAYEEGIFKLSEELNEEDILTAFGAQEKTLEKLNVPIPNAKPADEVKPEETGKEEEGTDPASVWGKQPGAATGEPDMVDSTPALREAMDTGNKAAIPGLIHKLRKEGHARVAIDPMTGVIVSELAPLRQEYEADPDPNSVGL